MKLFPLIFILLCTHIVFGQVKVGSNINTIDGSSLIELESDTKVLVVTRVSRAQMNSITPLNGALVYNTDDNCLFQYRSNTWVSLCVDIMGGQTVTTILDNLDGTFTYTNETGTAVIISKANLITNGDGSYSFSNGNSTISIETNAATNPYDNGNSGLGALNVQSAIDELKTDVDANKVDAETATTTNATAIAAHNLADGDLSATNELSDVDLTGTILNLTNPVAGATGVNLDTTFATDAELAAAADDDITSASLNAASILTINEGTSIVDVSLADLEESADITANTTAIQNLQADVDQNELDADAAIQNVQNDVDQNEIDAETAIQNVQNDVDQNEIDADIAIQNLQNDVNQNELDADAALLLKEDAANKSTDVTLADATNTLFPTELAVKTYVDGQITATADDDITSATLSAASVLTINEGTSFVDVSLADLEESADITANATAIQNVQDDVDQNELDTDAAMQNVQDDVDQNELDADAAIALKEDAANKSTDVALGTSDVMFPTQNAVKTYVDGQITATADDDITSATLNAASLLTINEGTSFVDVSLADLEESGEIMAEETRALAAEALKEDTANKSTDITLADATNTLFPTELAVKTYVDAFAITDVIAGNKIATITQSNGTTITDIDETITSFESPVGLANTLRYNNEAGASTDITDITRSVNGVNPAANGNVAVLLSNVTTGLEADRPASGVDADIYIVSGEVAPSADRNGVAFIYDDVTGWQEVTTDLSTSDARYLNVIGDSMVGILAMGGNVISNLSDPGNPQDAATKNYVDAQIAATSDDDITAVSFDGANLTVNEGATTSFSANLSALEESADISANTSAIVAEETRALAAEALKEDAANKSTDVALGTSDVAFPTQNAVKTYVDGQITATSDDDITSATLSAASLLTINEGTSFVDVSLADLEESADISANATAIQNVQDDVDQNELDADAALLLKEDVANKSTDVTLADATNTLFPTELAVKTYVDGQITATADDDITSATLSAASLLTINEGTSFVDVSLADLEESADIAANATAIQNVQGDIDQNELDADAAIQNVQNDVNQNELDADAAIQNIQDDVDQNELDADAAIQNIQDDVDQNELDADAAILLKEDATNKSTDVTLSDVTNTLFPTELAVKTYVDNASQHTGAEGSVYFAGAAGEPSENNGQLFWDTTNNRLGVGTNTPSHKIQVNGQVRATSFANANGTANAPSYRFNSDANSGIYSAATDQLGFSTGGNEAMRINASQNVGIGDFSTGTVDASLHIKSTGVPLKIEPSTTTPAGSSAGQMFVASDDGILYIFDGTRNKWLSVDRTMIGWGLNSNNTSNRYLRQFNGTDSSNSGWRIVRDGTITGITAQSNINQTWTLEIRKNDTNGVITSLTMTNAQGNEDGTINIDVSKGDFLQAYCNGNSVDYPEALIEIAWRK